MTTFQDLPPQSRRAVRQSERDGDANAAVTSAPLNLAQTFLPTPDADQSSPQAPPPTGRRSRVAPQSGLVDMPTSQSDGYTPEPLNYITQGAPGSQQPSAQQPGSQQPAAPSHVDSAPFAAAQQTGEQPSFRVRDFSPESRRAAAPAPQSAAAPLDYRTQAGPVPMPAPAEAAPAEAAPAEAASGEFAAASSFDSAAADSPATDSAAARPTTSEPSPFATQPPVAVSQTATQPPVAAAAAPVAAAAAPATSTPAPLGPPMSRRELRAREAEALAASGTFSGVFEVPELVEPVVAPPSNLSNAMAEFEALTRTAQPEVANQDADAAHEPDELTGASAEQLQGSEAVDQKAADDARAQEAQARLIQLREAAAQEAQARAAEQQARAHAAEQQAQAHAAQLAQEQAQEQEKAQAQAAHEAEQQRARDAALAAQATAQAEANARAAADEREKTELLAERKREYEAEQAERAREAQAPANPFDALFAAPAAPAAAVPATELNVPFVSPEIEQTGSHATSTGHWSRQAEIDDETQSIENTLSREVGMGNVATTTSALVLPIIPQDSDFGSVLNGTGEVLITGSIDLPRSLSSTGGDARRYDDPDVDNLFDAFDNEIISTDSAPVRAIRAVSTHTSTHGVVTTATKPRGNRLLVGVAIGAVVLAIAVVGLLVFVVSTLN